MAGKPLVLGSRSGTVGPTLVPTVKEGGLAHGGRLRSGVDVHLAGLIIGPKRQPRNNGIVDRWRSIAVEPLENQCIIQNAKTPILEHVKPLDRHRHPHVVGIPTRVWEGSDQLIPATEIAAGNGRGLLIRKTFDRIILVRSGIDLVCRPGIEDGKKDIRLCSCPCRRSAGSDHGLIEIHIACPIVAFTPVGRRFRLFNKLLLKGGARRTRRLEHHVRV